MSAAPASPEASPFPPADIGAFLSFCAGEWLALRSCFASPAEAAAAEALAAAALAAEAAEGGADGGADAEPQGITEEPWHSAERAELRVAFLEPEQADHPGGLEITPPGGAPPRRLHFGPGEPCDQGSTGCFQSGELEGRWQLWPDGSLELRLAEGGSEVRERIWFTKPNLRLRSCVEHGADGSPGRASFSSEIRRIARPASGGAG